MDVIALIFIYMTNCIAIIIFNIAYIMYVHIIKKHGKKNISYYEKQLHKLLVCNDNKYRKNIQKLLIRKLRNTNNIMSFEKALKIVCEQELDNHDKIVEFIKPVFTNLSKYYNKMDNISQAYFAHVTAKFKICNNMGSRRLAKYFISDLKRPSIYCRRNAMTVLCKSGNVDSMVEAVEMLNKEQIFLHEKTLTEGLLSFKGDHEELIDEIFRRFDIFSDNIKRVVIDYIRIQSGKHCKTIYKILCDEKEDREVRLSALRYFGKYYYEPAKETMIQILQNSEQVNWEYAAVAAFAISAYPDDKTEDILIDNLSNHNWYIRKNAAKTLADMGVAYKKISSIIEGDDQYAREVLMYYLDKKENEEV